MAEYSVNKSMKIKKIKINVYFIFKNICQYTE